MTTNRATDRRNDESTGGPDGINQDEVSRLFAAALGGDRRAEAALVLLGGYDDTAHRASIALVTAGHHLEEPVPPNVLASIDRTLAALRDRHRSS